MNCFFKQKISQGPTALFTTILIVARKNLAKALRHPSIPAEWAWARTSNLLNCMASATPEHGLRAT
jgi:hypothetical protein